MSAPAPAHTQVRRMIAAPSQPNILTDWPSLEQARAYATSPDLKNALQKAGVVSQPDVAFLESL
jgi:hypothetical protein